MRMGCISARGGKGALRVGYRACDNDFERCNIHGIKSRKKHTEKAYRAPCYSDDDEAPKEDEDVQIEKQQP